jgi:hypothetical protein
MQETDLSKLTIEELLSLQGEFYKNWQLQNLKNNSL